MEKIKKIIKEHSRIIIVGIAGCILLSIIRNMYANYKDLKLRRELKIIQDSLNDIEENLNIIEEELNIM